MVNLIDSDWVIDYLEEVPAAVQLIQPMIATLVTRNTDDYRDIPGLTLYR